LAAKWSFCPIPALPVKAGFVFFSPHSYGYAVQKNLHLKQKSLFPARTGQAGLPDHFVQAGSLQSKKFKLLLYLGRKKEDFPNFITDKDQPSLKNKFKTICWSTYPITTRKSPIK